MLALSSLFVGCTVQHEYTITPIKDFPKAENKKVVKKYVASVITTTDSSGRVALNSKPKRSPNMIEVYSIGPTVDEEGDLVGPHKLYRVVETSKWMFSQPHKSENKSLPTPIKPIKSTESDHPSQVSNDSKKAPEEAKTTAIDDRNAKAEAPPDVTPTPDTEMQSAIDKAFSIGTPKPTPGTQALEDFQKTQNQ